MKPVNKKLRQAWYGMMHRCNDEKDIGYRRYGGRGIKVCDRWLKYENFCEDMSESFQKHLLEHGPRQTTIDRIDSNGDYSKENCRWATYKIQQNNRSNNHIITIDGVSRSIMEWSRVVGVNKDLIYGRITQGWSEEQAVTTPVNKPLMYNGETASEADARLGGTRGLVRSRIRKNWSLRDAFTLPVGCRPVSIKH